jgi:hypothetical protein
MRRQTAYGKGDATRPRSISRAMWELNYAKAHGLISRSTYYRRKKKLKEQER